MERPAAPAPPKPCRPILDEAPLFPRYRMRGVLAAGARRPRRFGGRDGAARDPGVLAPASPARPRRGFLGCRVLHLLGRGQGEGMEAAAAADEDAAARRGVRGPAGRALGIPEAVAAGGSLPAASELLLLLLRGPPISSRRGARTAGSRLLGPSSSCSLLPAPR